MRVYEAGRMGMVGLGCEGLCWGLDRWLLERRDE